MHPQRTVDGATSQPPESTLVAPSPVPQRSARRATARRARGRRASARQHRDAAEGRIVEYLNDHPQRTTGDLAKGLNANRDTIAARVAHLVRTHATRKGEAVG
jgi:hypothetical protein